MPLTVALNALFLHYPTSGTGRYLHHLIAEASPRLELRLIGSRAFPPGDAIAGVSSPSLLPTPFDRSGNLAKVWFEQLAFPRAARASGAEVAHYPYFAAPLIGGLPTVVTVHDLVPILRPEYRRTALQRLYTALVTRGLRSAAAIVTDSAASAGDLRDRLRIPASRIRVIPLGVDSSFRPLATSEERAEAAAARARFGLARPFVVYLGGFDRRKNVETLVGAFGRLKRERRIPHDLVLIGRQRPGDELFYDPRPDGARLGLGDSLRLLGALPDDEVRALYTQADAFVFPSRYEGFGLTPLEAMACGVPVVCSNRSSLPEVMGEAGLLFDPDDESSLAETLGRVLLDAELRAELSGRGVERARSFSWSRTVDATIAVYAELASDGVRRAAPR